MGREKMGTRADFYVGEGKNAEWIGSVAWDGYEWGERIESGDHDKITSAKTEDDYRKAVRAKIESRDDGTLPEDGWPWPWEDSKTTDCAYCFIDGKVKAFSWGRPWDEDEDKIEWPDMSNVGEPAIAGSKRSGIMVFTVGGK
jgi:hypothetical protein